MASHEFVLDILKENDKVTEEQLEKAQEDVGVRTSSLLEALLLNGVMKEEDLVSFLSEYFSMPAFTIADHTLPLELTEIIPANFVRENLVVPVEKENDTLTVAMTNPLDVETIDNLMIELGKKPETSTLHIETVVAGPLDIQNAIDLYYRGQQMASMVEAAAGDDYADALKNIGEMAQGIDDSDDALIVRFVSAIITEGYRTRASDIHVEPLEKRIRIRYRIDGVLREMESPPKKLQGPIISRIKIMSGMNMAERRVPQDGRIKFAVDNKLLDLRVSALPGTHGESVVMRILDKSSLMLGLNELGFLEEDEQTFRDIISLPNGVFLVTGPTGSGKTTTLYGCLNFLNTSEVKLITVEDPVEYMLPGVNQVQVNDEINFGFSQALRSMLRQAPNIIMVGEIRDTTTAEIATQASLTGHLVFSTLHTNDAPSAVTRLIDMGVKPFLVATSIMGVMAQRLVRTVCKNCITPYQPDEKTVRALGLKEDYMKKHEWRHGAGCDECNGTGYKGRKGIFEIMTVNDEIRTLIYQSASSDEIRRTALKAGMGTLRMDGLKKAERGITTLEEVLRITVTDIS